MRSRPAKAFFVALTAGLLASSACGSGDDGSSSTGDGGSATAKTGVSGGSGSKTGGDASTGGSTGGGSGSAGGGSSGAASDAGHAGATDAGGGKTGTSNEAGSGTPVCTGDCSHCGALEECFDGKFCIPKAVTIPAPSGAAVTSYTVDATTVNHCQYANWLATKPSAAGQDPACVLQTDFVVDADCVSGDTHGCSGSGCDQVPQTCVTWCDAAAYCKGVGKQLCGKIGGGDQDFASFADATTDQWYNACSGGGKNTYPYGNTYEGAACNGYDNPSTGCNKVSSCGEVPGGQVTTCVSPVTGYGGVYDLSGNVFELEASCSSDVDGKDRCRFRGGSYISSYGNDNGNALRCNYDIAGTRDDRYPNLGFRCCQQ